MRGVDVVEIAATHSGAFSSDPMATFVELLGPYRPLLS